MPSKRASARGGNYTIGVEGKNHQRRIVEDIIELPLDAQQIALGAPQVA